MSKEINRPMKKVQVKNCEEEDIEENKITRMKICADAEKDMNVVAIYK